LIGNLYESKHTPSVEAGQALKPRCAGTHSYVPADKTSSRHQPRLRVTLPAFVTQADRLRSQSRDDQRSPELPPLNDTELSNLICGGNDATTGDPKAHRRYAQSDVVERDDSCTKAFTMR
jgi:hypothetical protein